MKYLLTNESGHVHAAIPHKDMALKIGAFLATIVPEVKVLLVRRDLEEAQVRECVISCDTYGVVTTEHLPAEGV